MKDLIQSLTALEQRLRDLETYLKDSIEHLGRYNERVDRQLEEQREAMKLQEKMRRKNL